jgi:hypothetical protein
MLSTQGVQSEAQGKNTNRRGHIMTYLNNTIAIFLDIGEKAAALASSDAYTTGRKYMIETFCRFLYVRLAFIAVLGSFGCRDIFE